MSTTSSAGQALRDRGRATTAARTRSSRRHRARPLGDGTTERVRVIEFIWGHGVAYQPVLLLERTLLD